MSEIGPGLRVDEPPAWATPASAEPTGATPASGEWVPQPGASGGGWAGGPTEWAPSAQPAPHHPPLRRGAAVAAIAAMMFASGGVGAAIGAATHRGSGRLAASAAIFSPSQLPSATAPSNGTIPTPSNGGTTPAPSASSRGLDAAAIAASVDPAVVDVTTTLAEGQAAGTGMVLTSSGLVLTNNHVIQGATDVRVQIAGSGPTYAATVLGYDATADVALLQVQGVSGLRTISVGDSSKVSVNDPVVAIGNALGRSGPPAVTQGVVAALDQSITANDNSGGSETLNGMIQMDAPLQPGDSGGPLVNAAGHVIGMNTAAAGGYRRYSASNVAFAVPINTALTIARQIQAGQATAQIHIGPRAILGVNVQNPSQAGSGNSGAGTPGAPVVGVQSGSPASRAGLAAGDVIVSVGGKTIGSVADLQPALDGYHPGDNVSIGWIDGSGQQRRATVRLAAGPPA